MRLPKKAQGLPWALCLTGAPTETLSATWSEPDQGLLQMSEGDRAQRAGFRQKWRPRWGARCARQASGE